MKSLDLLPLTFEGTKINCPISEGHRMIPVKTVCTIIDIDFSTQDNWLKKHLFFSQLYRLAYTTGADDKQYEMRCLSAFDLLAWLSSISENNRREGSMVKQFAFMAWLRKETMQMYKLIEIFQEENNYELELISRKSDLLDKMEEANRNLAELKKEIKTVNYTIEEVRAHRFTGQTALPFPTGK